MYIYTYIYAMFIAASVYLGLLKCNVYIYWGNKSENDKANPRPCRGVRGHAPLEENVLQFKVKRINLVHYESKIKRLDQCNIMLFEPAPDWLWGLVIRSDDCPSPPPPPPPHPPPPPPPPFLSFFFSLFFFF